MKKRYPFSSLVSVVLVFVCVAPFVYVFVQSLLSAEGGFTLRHYYDALLSTSAYLHRFWRSLTLTICIAVGQVVISTLAGYGFAKCSFTGKNTVFFLLIILMIMPLQVTLVPNYIMLDKLGLLNTYYALALPMIFVPLGTFIMTQCFKSVPDSILEAARLDGCRTLGVIYRVAVPMNKSGLVCVMLLSFLDGWNMVEQPIAYLKDFGDYPISVALAMTAPADSSVKLVCCMLVILSPLFLFLYFNRELVEGIAFGEEK